MLTKVYQAVIYLTVRPITDIERTCFSDATKDKTHAVVDDDGYVQDWTTEDRAKAAVISLFEMDIDDGSLWRLEEVV